MLRGGRKRLLDAEATVPALGDRVTPAAQAYVETWIDRAKQLADAAQRHAESLQGAAISYTSVETHVESDLAELLPWLQRHGTTPPTPRTPWSPRSGRRTPSPRAARWPRAPPTYASCDASSPSTSTTRPR